MSFRMNPNEVPASPRTSLGLWPLQSLESPPYLLPPFLLIFGLLAHVSLQPHCHGEDRLVVFDLLAKQLVDEGLRDEPEHPLREHQGRSQKTPVRCRRVGTASITSRARFSQVGRELGFPWDLMGSLEPRLELGEFSGRHLGHASRQTQDALGNMW